jgi:F-type H+-transporting ATPase subunit delta
MRGEAIAKRYALALTRLCSNPEEWEALRKEILLTISIVSENKEFRDFMENPVFPKNLKINVLMRISDELKLSEKMKRFLNILVQKGRFSLLNLILKNFEDIWNKRNNIHKMEIISSIPLDEKEKSEIIETLSRIKKGIIKANFIVDPEILGGIIIKEGNKIFDCSIKGNLERLKNKIMEGERLWK